MTTIGTSRQPAPPLVERAQAFFADGVPWREAAVQLQHAAAGDRVSLREAVHHWLQVVRRRPTGDPESTAVLRALERALASTPRPTATWG